MALARESGHIVATMFEKTNRGAFLRLLVLSVVSGIALGVAARVVMRFVALESGLPGSYSLRGSLEVAGFGTLLGTPLAFAFFLFRPKVALAAPWAGLIFGLALFGVLSVLRPPSAESALAGTPDTPSATAIAFALLFVLWGMGVDVLSRRFMPNKHSSSPPPIVI